MSTDYFFVKEHSVPFDEFRKVVECAGLQLTPKGMLYDSESGNFVAVNRNNKGDVVGFTRFGANDPDPIIGKLSEELAGVGYMNEHDDYLPYCPEE